MAFFKKIIILFLFFPLFAWGQPSPVLDMAEDIGIEDDGAYFSGDTVEDALQELGSSDGGSPGGDSNDVQYNNGTDFEGEDAFQYDFTNNELEVTTVIGGGATSVTEPDLRANLTAYWTFDEDDAGITYADSSGNGNDFTLTGGDTTTDLSEPGKIGNGANLDSGNDYVLTDSQISGTGDMTVAFFIKPTAVDGSAVAYQYGGATADEGDIRIFCKNTTSGEMRFIRWTGSGNGHEFFDGSSDIGITAGEWQFFAFVYDSGTMYIRRNNTTESDATPSTGTWTFSASNFGIGTVNSVVDNFMHWNRALSDAELDIIYRAGVGIDHVPDGDVIKGIISADTNDTSAFVSADGNAHIFASHDGEFQGNLRVENNLTMGGNIEFDSGVLTIDSDNFKIGINQGSPKYPLHVTEKVGTSCIFADGDLDVKRRIRVSYGHNSNYIECYGNDSTYDIRSRSNYNLDLVGGGTGDTSIWTDADSDFIVESGGTTTLFLINNSGNVGIGTTTPEQQIEMTGAITLNEMTAPGTPSSNKGVLYLVDDGDGTQTLYVKFDDGTAVALGAN